MNSIVNGPAADLRSLYRVGGDTPRDVESAALTNGLVVIGDTSTVAVVGDIYRAVNGTLANIEIPIVAVTANSITLATTTLPTVADTFFVLRRVTIRTDDNGALSVVASPGPAQFVLDGVDTEVEESTGTPANSRPFPVKLFTTGGADTLGDDLLAAAQATAADLDALESNFGTAIDTAASSDTGTFTFMAFVKRILEKLTLINTDTTAIAAVDFSTETTQLLNEGWLNQLNGVFGLQSDAAASSDAGTFSFMALFKRSLEKLTLINSDTTAAAADLALLEGKDFATETTSAAILADTASLDTKLPAQGQAAMAASVPVTMASDQTAIPVRSPVNTNGSMVNEALTATTAETVTAPANAVGFMLAADDDNSDPIRYAIGATASTTVGTRLAPGRDTGFVPCAANISVCATAASGSNNYTVQWILSS